MTAGREMGSDSSGLDGISDEPTGHNPDNGQT